MLGASNVDQLYEDMHAIQVPLRIYTTTPACILTAELISLSVSFYPRDAMLARLYAMAIPSVCLTRVVLCIKKAKRYVEIFYRLIATSF